jgi:hypothetical protein
MVATTDPSTGLTTSIRCSPPGASFPLIQCPAMLSPVRVSVMNTTLRSIENRIHVKSVRGYPRTVGPAMAHHGVET